MLHPNFVILGAVFNMIGGISYLLDTINGKVKPNRVTWFLWTVAPMIAFSAEIKEGVGIQSLMTFMVGFNPLLIFIASFINKKSYWKLGRLDISCGSLSVLGIILWYIFRNANIAILFSIFADGLAAVPTLVKSWQFPETENYYVFAAGAVSALLTILTITTWDFAHLGFPLYILLVNVAFVLFIKFRIGKLFSHVDVRHSASKDV